MPTMIITVMITKKDKSDDDNLIDIEIDKTTVMIIISVIFSID